MVEQEAFRTLASALMERYQLARMAGMTFGNKRDLYEVLGYSRILSGKDYRDRYARGGLAHRIVECYPKATWRGGLEIYDDEDPKHVTEFEKAIVDLNKKLKLWPLLRRLDILAGMSSYAVALLGAPDDPSTELPKNGKLLYLTLFSGGGGPGYSGTVGSAGDQSDATIADLVQDVKDSRYGLPSTYRLNRLASTPEYNKPVHWSRILHVAEGCLDNDVYGSPVLEPVWNLLDDLEKCTGGGAEAFWLRVNKGLVLNVEKDAALTAEEKTALTAQADEYQHQLRRILQTRKVDVKDLGSDVANFANQVDGIITQIAGTLGIPKRILTGSEMGELASSQDRENWRDQVNGRRTEYAEPYILRPFVNRLIEYGYLPQPQGGEYFVDWSTMQALTTDERAKGAAAWAGVNQTYGSVVYTSDEIRDTWSDLPPLTEEQKAAAAPPQPAGEPPAPEPVVAEGALDDELLRALEAAIDASDTCTLDRILGVERPVAPQPISQPHITVNMPEARQQEPPTIIVNVPDQRPAVTGLDKRLEYDDEGRIVRIISESVQ